MLFSAGTTDITPRAGLPLAGFAVDRKAVSISDSLEANVLAAKDENGAVAVIVSADLLYVGPDLSRRLERYVAERHGMDSANLALAASHTHYAPGTDRSKPRLGRVEARYLALAGDRIEALIDRVLTGTFTGASARSDARDAPGLVHRRLPWPYPRLQRRGFIFNEPVMARNPAVDFDRRLRVWELADADGRTLAIVWSLACHPTKYPFPHSITADFVGVVRRRLRVMTGADTPVLFLQGFSGDVSPDTGPIPVRSLRALARVVFLGRNFPDFAPDAWTRWTLDLSEAAANVFHQMRSASANPVAGDIFARQADVPLADIIVGDPAAQDACAFRRIRLGDAIDIVAVAAEVSNGLAGAVPFPGAVTVGCAGDCFGYWPTDRQRKEGGYEGGRFVQSFGKKGRLKSGLDARFAKAITLLDA